MVWFKRNQPLACKYYPYLLIVNSLNYELLTERSGDIANFHFVGLVMCGNVQWIGLFFLKRLGTNYVYHPMRKSNTTAI